MTHIAENDYYELNFDEGGNCIYWKMKGFWPDMSVAPDFHKDWSRAIKLTAPGWKVFSDASTCRAVPAEVTEEKIKNQKMLLEAGCSRIALIADSAITKISIKNGTSKSGMNSIIKNFESSQKDEAFDWLNS